ncbi:MAG: queuosine precursor transporter [Planctomycetota bacterium]
MRAMTLAQRRARFQNDYVYYAAIFAVLMVLTNVIGTKLFALFPHLLDQGFGALSGHGPVILTTGLITYPATFLLTDVVSEVYGRRAANRMVILGFLSSLVMLAIVHIAVALPPADRYWGDASGGLLHQARVVVVDGDAVLLDQAAGFAPAGGRAAVVRVEDPGRWRVQLRDVVEHGPVATARSGGEAGYARARMDLDGDLQAGDILVPAVRVQAIEADGTGVRVRLEDARLAPPQGALLAADGSWHSYAGIAPGGWVQLPPDSTVAVDDVLAVANFMSPSQMQHAFDSVFAAPGILLLASMVAYLVAQFLDVWLFHFWRRITAGRWLWLRNNGSTFISQLVDTIIVNGIFLPMAFGMGFEATAYVIVCNYIVKMCLALIDTPLIYLGVWWAKRRLGLDMAEEVPPELSAIGGDPATPVPAQP